MLPLAILHPRPAHGYAIIEELRRRSGGKFDLAEGTVYPALHRLERVGIATSRVRGEEAEAAYRALFVGA